MYLLQRLETGGARAVRGLIAEFRDYLGQTPFFTDQEMERPGAGWVEGGRRAEIEKKSLSSVPTFQDLIVHLLSGQLLKTTFLKIKCVRRALPYRASSRDLRIQGGRKRTKRN